MMRVLFFNQPELSPAGAPAADAKTKSTLVWAALFTAWHYTRPGPGGAPLPLVPLGTTPTRIDGAVHISRLFRESRIERTDGGFDPKPGPFRFVFEEEEHFAMLRQWWNAYAGEIVHNVAAEQVKTVNDALEGKLETVPCRTFTAEEWAVFRLAEKTAETQAIDALVEGPPRSAETPDAE